MIFRKIFTVAALVSFFGATGALAQEGAAAPAHAAGGMDPGVAMAAALAIAIAAAGGAIGQGMTAKAALDGIARNPAADGKIRTPMIIALALIESLVLYAFVIAFIKIH